MQRPAHVNEEREETMTDKLTKFDYLLNAMQHAGQEENPAHAGYGDKRRALFEHVRALEKDAERYRWLRAQCDSVTNLVQYRRGNAHNTIPCHTAGYMDLSIDRAMATEPAVGAA